VIDVAGAQPSFPLQSIFFVIYTFHMPLFFFLSATLVQGRVERAPGRFFQSIGKRIVYPYLLWSIVQFTLIFTAGTLVNSPVDAYWPTILSLPWKPVSQFWFLYALGLLQLATLVVLTVAPRRGPWILLGAGVALRIVVVFAPGPGPLGQAMVFAVYYALGLLMGSAGTERIARLPWAGIAAVAGATAVAIASAFLLSLLPLLANTPDPSSPQLAGAGWAPAAIPAALLGSLLIVMLSMKLQQSLMSLAAYLGQASMAIYLTHVIIIAGARIALQHTIGPIDPLLLVPGLTLLGLTGGLAARAAAQYLGIAQWTALQ
jgi:fucose 4-O-acetylase-like acetyltransferase